MLLWLPPKYELSFFDQYYPSMSDPGAYVSVQRKDDLLMYKLANHGWSGEWRRQSPEFIAAYLVLNKEKTRIYNEASYSILLTQVFKTPWDE
jgi:hypothetical protein